MAAHARILNITTQSEVKAGQARRWVESGVFAWVEVGVSIRKLSVAEMVVERSRLPVELEPYPYAEVRGVVVRGLQDIATERELARVAIHFEGSMMAPREKARLSAAGDVWGGGLRRLRHAQFKAALAEVRR